MIPMGRGIAGPVTSQRSVRYNKKAAEQQVPGGLDSSYRFGYLALTSSISLGAVSDFRKAMSCIRSALDSSK